MEKLKMMKESLIACAQTQMGNLQNVDAKELGEAIDMIKDLEEAIYYCTITKAMEDKDKSEGKEHHQPYPMERVMMYPVMYNANGTGAGMRGFEEPMYNRMYGGHLYDPYLEQQMDRYKEPGMMYYSNGSGSAGGNSSGGSSSSNSGASGSRNYPMEIRDAREGRSGIRRRYYMEAKEDKHATPVKMKELEEYLKELSEDITEMIEGASPEEKTVLQQKLVNLANKVKNV